MPDFKSDYSPAQTQKIMCITRGRECTSEKCLKCGWLQEVVRKSLNERQAEWDAKEEEDIMKRTWWSWWKSEDYTWKKIYVLVFLIVLLALARFVIWLSS